MTATTPLPAGMGAEEWRKLLGRKVSVRYRTGDPAAAPNEAIGVVRSVSSEKVTVTTKRGEDRDFPIAGVMAGKAWL